MSRRRTSGEADPLSQSDLGPDVPVEPGIVLRPTPTVLGEDALVPPTNIVEPRPADLSHELTEDEPFWFDGVARDQPPSGTLAKGTRVAVLKASPDLVRVVDERGLAVDVRGEHVRDVT